MVRVQRPVSVAVAPLLAVLALAGVALPSSAAAAAKARRALAAETALAPGPLAINPAGDIFFVNRAENVVDRITPSGEVTLEAGVPGKAGAPKPGPATSSPFSNPTGLAIGAEGDLYIADGGKNQVVEKVTPEGHLSIVAGDLGVTGQVPEPGLATETELLGVNGLATDEEGDFYINDEFHSVIEKVTPSGQLSIAAGTQDALGPPEPGSVKLSGFNGYPESFYELSSTLLFLPQAITEAGGDLYIADSGSHVVEKVAPSGETEVIAGDGGIGAPTAGPATESTLDIPTGLAVDTHGNVYIADPVNHVVEKVTPEGELSIVAGDGQEGPPSTGLATDSALGGPTAVVVDAHGDLFISDESNHVIEKVDTEGRLSIFGGTGEGAEAPEPAKKTECSEEVLTKTYINVTVPAGHDCTLKGAHVEGHISAKGATGLTIDKSKITGNLKVHATAGAVMVSNTTVGGSITVAGTVGSVSVTGATVGRSVKVDENEGPVMVETNEVAGTLKVAANTGSPESTIVLGNIVTGKASCTEDADLAVSCNAGGTSASAKH